VSRGSGVAQRGQRPRRLVAAVFVALAGCGLATDPAPAAIAPTLVLDAAEEQELHAIETYFNSIRTVRSGFVQQSSNGRQAKGTLYLSRPGRLRVEYAPPVPVLVVATGTLLIYYDSSLEQLSQLPLSSTPAGILLQEHVSLFDGELTVTSFERRDGTLRVGLIRTGRPGDGSITLVFDAQPLSLREWEVTDAQGVITAVTLVDPQFAVRLDPKLFRFDDPRLQKPREFP